MCNALSVKKTPCTQGFLFQTCMWEQRIQVCSWWRVYWIGTHILSIDLKKYFSKLVDTVVLMDVLNHNVLYLGYFVWFSLFSICCWYFSIHSCLQFLIKCGCFSKTYSEDGNTNNFFVMARGSWYIKESGWPK